LKTACRKKFTNGRTLAAEGNADALTLWDVQHSAIIETACRKKFTNGSARAVSPYAATPLERPRSRVTGAHAAIRGLRRAHGTFDPTEPRRLRRRSCGVCGVAGGLRPSILFLLQEEAVQTSAQLGGVVAPPMKGGDAAYALDNFMRCCSRFLGELPLLERKRAWQLLQGAAQRVAASTTRNVRQRTR